MRVGALMIAGLVARVTAGAGLALGSAVGAMWMPAASAQQAQPEREGRAMEVELSNHTLQLRYFTDGDMVNVDHGQMVFGGFLSEDRDVVGTAGLMIPIDLSFGRFSFSVGPQAYAALLDEENNDVFALALGAEVRFDVSQREEFAIVGSAFYSPDVLTFGSADNVTDLSARAEARLAEHLIGFAGFRWFELDLLMTQELKLQDEAFAGIRWRFE